MADTKLIHDLNNILSIIQGHARLAERGVRNHQDVTRHFEDIRHAITRASALLADEQIASDKNVSSNI